jgi:TonB-dependent SusC/RagA subfamily outer membrane receptor
MDNAPDQNKISSDRVIYKDSKRKVIMKTTVTKLQLFLSVFSMVILGACSGTLNTANSSLKPYSEAVDNGYQLVPAEHVNQSNIMVYPNRDQPTNMTLTDMMRRLPGVRVAGGNGPGTKIVVDGPSSWIAKTDPLFVVNGTSVGTNFSTLYTLVIPKDIISLSVLKGPDATIYGSRGANGVILIRTK